VRRTSLFESVWLISYLNIQLTLVLLVNPLF
jgi:hypothetical protein